MFDEPEENPSGRAIDPITRAKDKCDEFRMHAELAAVFEGCRKFGAEIRPKLSANVARDIQRTIGKLEKSKSPEHPILPEPSMAEAGRVLDLPNSAELSTNDYHIHARPGETMIVRFLAGDQVESFYQRMQAHFDAALNQFRAEERAANEWKQDPPTMKYLEAMDKLEVKMPERYLRPVIVESKKLNLPTGFGLFVLSTQTADEIDIIHLADYLMGVPPEEVVGMQSAPPEDGATEADRAWFFKLFSLRGIQNGQERMCFFIFLQKTQSEW